MEKETINTLIDKIDTLINSITRIKNIQSNEFEYLDNQEFMQMLHISKRTAQSWRDKGIIPYSIIQKKVYYHKKDIIALMERNYVRSFYNDKNTVNNINRLN